MYATSSISTAARRRASRQQAAGVCLQVALLAGLSVGVGLGPAGWLVGVGYALGLAALLGAAARRAGTTALGPADLVTLARAGLGGGVTALVVDHLAGAATPVAVLVGIAAVALTLDAVDGKVARRTGTVSALGARFDMEVDAFLVLVLSVQVAGLVGPWVLAIGLMRYVFVAASWTMPWLRGSLPTRYFAKTVAALQGIVLVVAAAGVLPYAVTFALVAAALATLLWSFGSSVVWLWRAAHPSRRPTIAALPTTRFRAPQPQH